MQELDQEQYQVLFAFRCALRHYLQWSAAHAAKFGLAPQQAQLLLAIRVRPSDSPPSISDLAASLQIRQHSAVGLANRAQRAGLVARSIDPHDQRVVRIGLTEHGHSVIAQLAESHLAELQLVAATLHLSDEFLANLSQQFSGLLPPSDEESDDGAVPVESMDDAEIGDDEADHGETDWCGDDESVGQAVGQAPADASASATGARRRRGTRTSRDPAAEPAESGGRRGPLHRPAVTADRMAG